MPHTDRQGPTNPTPLLGWFHKQAVEIDVAVGPDQDEAKPIILEPNSATNTRPDEI